ncbi:DJ-1 family glyoxalase III [Halomonas sp. WWR20]
MPQVLLPIAHGSEDIETVTLIDVLRRAEIEVCVASVEEEETVTLARGSRLVADVRLSSLREDQVYDLIVLPGGMPGAERLRDCLPLRGFLTRQQEAQRWVGAICAAPGVVLAAYDMVRGRAVTGFPAFQAPLEEAGGRLTHMTVVEDGWLITSQGPGTAIPFALHLVRRLVDDAAAHRIAEAMLVDTP